MNTGSYLERFSPRTNTGRILHRLCFQHPSPLNMEGLLDILTCLESNRERMGVSVLLEFPEICALVTRDPIAKICVPKGVKGDTDNTQSIETKQMVRFQAHLKVNVFNRNCLVWLN